MPDTEFDFFRPFRQCFYCKSRKKLKRVVHAGYHTTFTYYHDVCLGKVSSNPESYPKFVDQAIQIIDQINTDNQNERVQRNREFVQQQQLQQTYRHIENIRNLRHYDSSDYYRGVAGNTGLQGNTELQGNLGPSAHNYTQLQYTGIQGYGNIGIATGVPEPITSVVLNYDEKRGEISLDYEKQEEQQIELKDIKFNNKFKNMFKEEKGK